MAKLFRHLGIGGKKVSDQPCQGEFMSGKTSGSVQELRSTSPSKNRASAVVVASNSWLGSAAGPDVGADGRRHSDASTIRSVRSRLPSHQRSDLNSRANRPRAGGTYQREISESQRTTRSPGERPECAAREQSSTTVTSPQIATEYCDPFDLKQLGRPGKSEVNSDVRAWSSEDDYSVPYEGLSDPMAFREIDKDVKKLPLPKPDAISCDSGITLEDKRAGDVSGTADHAELMKESAEGTAGMHDTGTIGSAARTMEPVEDDRLSSITDADETVQNVDLIEGREATDESTKSHLPDEFDTSIEGCDSGLAVGGSPDMLGLEGPVFLSDPSAGMYDAPWDLFTTQRSLEEKLLRASHCSSDSKTSSIKEGDLVADSLEKQHDDAMQIYDEPWDKKAESLTQNFFLASAARESLSGCRSSMTVRGEKSQRYHVHEPGCSHRSDQSLKLKQCKSVGDQQRIRTGVRTGISSCYPVQSVQSLFCVLHPDHSFKGRHSTYQPRSEGVDDRLPLEQQSWYHGKISRVDAESLLRVHREGSYLVRMSESDSRDYSLSLKSSRGEFMHMKIVRCDMGFILGQFSQPFDNIPQMILYYTINKLPIRGTEHMTLSFPVCSELP